MAKQTKADPSAARKTAQARVQRAVPGKAVRLDLELPSTARAIVGAVRQVMKAASELRCGPSDRADMEIVLREALANAVFHGNGADPEKKVFLHCTLSKTRGMVVSIRDQGRGFAPEDVPDPTEQDRRFLHHGRGLFLMRRLTDRIEHRLGGREIVLYKKPGADRSKKR